MDLSLGSKSLFRLTFLCSIFCVGIIKSWVLKNIESLCEWPKAVET